MSRLALIPKLLKLSLSSGFRPALRNNFAAPAPQLIFQRFNSAAANPVEESATQAAEASLEVKNLDLCHLLKDSLSQRGISTLFSIQAECFPHILEGKDLVGRARTGTGKTLAFALPMIERMQRNPTADRSRPRVLILAPTRELANQVQKEFLQLAGNSFKSVCIYGGAAYGPQENALRRGVDCVVGTPGRVQDMIEKGSLRLGNIETLILDEADHMLDIGFARDLDNVLHALRDAKRREVASNPRTSEDFQFLLFSATVPDWIKKAIRKYLKPDHIYIDHVGTDVMKCNTSITQLTIPTLRHQVTDTVAGLLQTHRTVDGRCIVFCETKHRCDSLSEELCDVPGVKALALHGDVSQAARERALDRFRAGRLTCLVATDVAARGLDIPNVELVIQTEPPKSTETFIHRSGRTGRAGKTGTNVILSPPDRQNEIDQIARGAGVNFKVFPAPAGLSDYLGNDKDDIMAKAFAECPQINSGPRPRSMIDCTENMVTMEFRGSPRSSELTDTLYKLFKLDPLDINPRQISSFKDQKGLVFDVNIEVVRSILEAQQLVDPSKIVYPISVCTSLPEIIRDRDSLKLNYRTNKRQTNATSTLTNRYARPIGQRTFRNEDHDEFSKWGNRDSGSRGGFGSRDSGSRGGFGSRDSGSRGGFGSRDSGSRDSFGSRGGFGARDF